MKLIQTLDISEGISMDTLKPILNSGAESSYESCLGVKETPGDDLIHPDKRPQKSLQKDKCVSDKTVESVGSNAKKMFEKVDLNSSVSADISLKRDSWNSGTVYSKCSEKENIVENSEMRFDILSDDESESLHLKISTDEENSIDELPQNISFDEDHNESNHIAVSDDSKSNENSDPERGLLRSGDDLSCKELTTSESIDVEVLPEDKEPSKTDSISIPVSESGHVSSAEDLDNPQSCSKVVQPVPGPNSTSIDSIEDVGKEEKNVEIEKKDTVSDHDQSTSSYVKDSEDKVSKKLVDHLDSTPEKLSVQSNVKKGDCVTKKRNFGGEIKSNLQHNFSLNDEKSDSFEGDKFLRSDKKAKSAIEDDCHASTTKDLRDEEEFLLSKERKGPLELMEFSDAMTSNEFCDDVDVLDSIGETNEKLLVGVLDASKSEEGIPIGDDHIDEQTEQLLLDSGSEDNVSSQETNSNNFSVRTDDHPHGNSPLSVLERVSKISVGNKKEVCDSDKLDASRLPIRNILGSFPNSKVLSKGQDLIDVKKGCVVSKDNDLMNMKGGCALSKKEDLVDQKERCIIGKSNDLVDLQEGCVLSKSENPIDQEEGCMLGKSKDLVVKKEGCVLGESKEVIDDKECCVVNKSKDLIEKGGCELKVCSETSSSRKRELQQNLNEALGRKRASPISDDKLGISVKRSKVDKEDCDGLLVLSSSEVEEEKVKKAKIEKGNNKLKVVRKEVPKKEVVIQEVPKKEVVKQEMAKKELSNTETSVGGKSSKLTLGTKDNKMDISEKITEELKSDKVDSKTNLEDSNKKLNPLPLLRNFDRAQLKTMTRNDLEELVLQKICEAITERSICGELRELAVNLDQKLKSWQKKSLQLTKQVKDLSLVLKRYGSDLQSKGANATPLKITRSVGLQVQMPGSSTGICWHPDDQSWKKGEKVAAAEKATAASSSSVKSVVPNVLPKSTPPPSPAAKVTHNSPASQKETENSRVSSSLATHQNSQSLTVGIKVLPSKPPVSASPIATNKTSQKTTIPPVNNRLKPSSDLQVIDLTDNEEKSKSSSSQTPSSDVATAAIPSHTNSTVPRSIRVVQHLSGTNSSLLSQTVTTPMAGRVAYYVPTTSVQQRQVIISNPSIRPSSVVVSNRQNSLPAIVLNSKNMVPMAAVPASNANIIRTPNISNALQLGTPRTPPRTAQFLQRLPVAATSVSTTGVLGSSVCLHPAPLPPVPLSGPSNPNWKLSPPKPDLKISKVPNRNQQGIVLSWNMTISSEYEEIASYQLFAYQEGNAPPSTNLWKKVGDVKALPLPMACTLTQFMEGHKYHFAVRAVDVYARCGPFSTPGNIVLTRN